MLKIFEENSNSCDQGCQEKAGGRIEASEEGRDNTLRDFHLGAGTFETPVFTLQPHDLAHSGNP